MPAQRLTFSRMTTVDHAERLASIGLTDVGAVRAFTGGTLIKNHQGLRDIVRLSIDHPRGGPIVLFLKRNLKPASKHAWSVVRFGRYRSASDLEWRNLRRLEMAGVNVSKPVAVGSIFGPVGERFSFILTEGAPGTALDELATMPLPFRERRRAIDAAADLVRKIHRAGWSLPGMYARHIFIDLAGRGPAIATMIDIDRLRILDPAAEQRESELALLHLSIPRASASRTERLRFLERYLGVEFDDSSSRGLLEQIGAQSRFHRRRKPSIAAAFDRAPQDSSGISR